MQMQALVSARALNPEQWADAEKRRLERRAAELDAALAKERKRRAHAAKLRGVLTQLDEQCSEASFHSPWRSGARCGLWVKSAGPGQPQPFHAV